MCILMAFNDTTSLSLSPPSSSSSSSSSSFSLSGSASPPVLSLSYAALMTLCGVEDPKELQPHVLGLCTKLKVLLREGTGKHVNADDTFTVNADFKSKFKRIKVPIVNVKESGGANGAGAGDGAGGGGGSGADGDAASDNALLQVVEDERKHTTEAAIVRVMKTRKTFSHNDLVAEVTKQLSSRFSAQPPVSFSSRARLCVSPRSPLLC